ncbi:sensor histidine kinase [Schnuerera sp. xch1]|uniref:sensor histidine kinase n=1 Tax=Schnuerera sp. xch1 TaxID=2874283 RepID=UPI001CC09183|nr:sensor histidine kinase [Schnuerera sp. xch1]MBZ2175805.1 sensor histidine kinase [Schnuerera sp. xch1]
MKKQKELLIASLIVGLFSILYIDFYVENFKFSFAAVVFPILVFMNDEFNPITFGITSGISLVLIRGILSQAFQGILVETFLYSLPEYGFYMIYGFILYIVKKNFEPITQNSMIFICFIGDLLSNIVEMYIRVGNDLFATGFDIINTFALVAIIRAGLVWLIIFAYRYNKLLIVREEHDKRYRNLLQLISQLKSETYLMEKNMSYIEIVMSNAYKLFNDIEEYKNRDAWAKQALEIAKDIHEIKKEYGLVVAGIEEIMEDRLDHVGMYLDEMITILNKSLQREIKNQNKNISIKFDIGENFYTKKHYYIISILRNIIMNAIDSIESDGNINISHFVKTHQHIFIISDDGCGISKKDLPHIFSHGYSTKIDYSIGQINRGLGLSIVKNILEESLKGGIEVESQLGFGSTFTICIPVKELESDD